MLKAVSGLKSPEVLSEMSLWFYKTFQILLIELRISHLDFLESKMTSRLFTLEYFRNKLRLSEELLTVYDSETLQDAFSDEVEVSTTNNDELLSVSAVIDELNVEIM
ncbi:CLUMA_CG006420, isoform A [Clunio marinus]|uniref:CLUMA_CG006420, isoform A n=1 Tax=Clunio marinus TaxID=568069 RepID=A0A1J1I362_9DIPT|nr:CLUMA_CG006420, isoform A [Clunio marinus]